MGIYFVNIHNTSLHKPSVSLNKAHIFLNIYLCGYVLHEKSIWICRQWCNLSWYLNISVREFPLLIIYYKILKMYLDVVIMLKTTYYNATKYFEDQDPRTKTTCSTRPPAIGEFLLYFFCLQICEIIHTNKTAVSHRLLLDGSTSIRTGLHRYLILLNVFNR